MSVNHLLTSYKPFDDLEKIDLELFRAFVKKYGDKIYDRRPGHPVITASAIVVNPEFSKTLVMHHRLHNTYRQFGGHTDGNPNMVDVAIDELLQESGAHGKLLTPQPFDLIRWNFPDRTKNNVFFPAHDCFDIAFLFMMNNDVKLKPNKNEVSDIKWISLEEWRDFHDAENEVVKANPSETHYNLRTYKKIKSFQR